MLEDANWGSPLSSAEGAASVPTINVWFGGKVGCSLAANQGAEGTVELAAR